MFVREDAGRRAKFVHKSVGWELKFVQKSAVLLVRKNVKTWYID